MILFCSFYFSTNFDKSILKHFFVCCFDDFLDMVELLLKCSFDFRSAFYTASMVGLSALLLVICCLALVMLIFLKLKIFLPGMMNSVMHTLWMIYFEWIYLGFAVSLLRCKHWRFGRDIKLDRFVNFAYKRADSWNSGFAGLLSCRSFRFGIFLSGTIFHE